MFETIEEKKLFLIKLFINNVFVFVLHDLWFELEQRFHISQFKFKHR